MIEVFTPSKSAVNETPGIMNNQTSVEGAIEDNMSRIGLEWFVKFTSIGGFAQARDSDNKLSRLAWTLLFLVGLALTVWGIVVLVISFCEYKSITNMDLGHNRSGMMFPAVAVCNQNRIHCGHLYNKIISCGQVQNLCFLKGNSNKLKYFRFF